jgi:hypothetical protein
MDYFGGNESGSKTLNEVASLFGKFLNQIFEVYASSLATPSGASVSRTVDARMLTSSKDCLMPILNDFKDDSEASIRKASLDNLINLGLGQKNSRESLSSINTPNQSCSIPAINSDTELSECNDEINERVERTIISWYTIVGIKIKDEKYDSLIRQLKSPMIDRLENKIHQKEKKDGQEELLAILLREMIKLIPLIPPNDFDIFVGQYLLHKDVSVVRATCFSILQIFDKHSEARYG